MKDGASASIDYLPLQTKQSLRKETVWFIGTEEQGGSTFRGITVKQVLQTEKRED